MANQPPGYIPPEYSATPVVSPTESITFSDTGSMPQQHHFGVPLQMNVFTEQDPYPADQRWYPHEYPLDSSAAHQGLSNHPHQQTSYENVTPHRLPVTSAVHGPSGNMTSPAVDNWGQVVPPIPVPVASPVHPQVPHVSSSLLQPWSHQMVHRHQLRPGSLHQSSRHDSISSTSVATTMSTATTVTDEHNDYSHFDTKPTPSPIHDRPEFNQGLLTDRRNIRLPAAASFADDDEEPSSPPRDITSIQIGHQRHYSSSQVQPEMGQTVASPSASSILSSESQPPSQAPGEAAPARRKRGRPPNKDKGGDASKTKAQRVSRRQPHNQVERKYREGLNHEMEKLRRAIPPLPQSPVPAGQKASKAQVLQGAVQEIERLREEKEEAERERDQYKEEVERLKQGGPVIGRAVETI